jgi:hypothetical protein
MFLVIEFISTYVNPLSTFAAAGISSATVIWQTIKGNDGVKEELKAEIEGVKKKRKADIDGVNKDLKAEIEHVQAIALGSRYATMKCLSGEKKMMTKWMDDTYRKVCCVRRPKLCPRQGYPEAQEEGLRRF